MTFEQNKNNSTPLRVEMINQIATIVQGIRFGSVEIIIHDGKVVQIERKEKIRFDTK
jgi:hypothetical protein